MLLENKYARAILRTLYENGPLTRKEIMHRVKMRLNSLVDVFHELCEAGYVYLDSQTRIRNVPLALNASKFGVLGIEHARDFLLIVLLDVTGKITADKTYSLSPDLNGMDRVELICSCIRDFMDAQLCDVIAIGFADIGIVNTEKGTAVYSVHVSDWQDIPLEEIIRSRFNVFCRIVDRTGAAALDKLRTSPNDVKVQNSLQVYVGNGIGASILQNGRYWAAETPSSCQIGHTIFQPDGEKCRCGNRGCVETVASIPALVRTAAVRTDGRISTKAQFFDACKSGDEACLEILRRGGEIIGISVASVITFTGITNVFLRSELCQVSDVYFNAVKDTLSKNVIYPFSKNVTVQVNTQTMNCSAIGAAYYAQKTYFNLP